MYGNSNLCSRVFWGVESAYEKIEGVEKTTVGYTGGKTKNPTYEQVCTDKTGHAEVVQIIYNPEKITYEKLLDIFWSIHDPTQKNKQGLDIGTQYRSAIFYHNQEQKEIAEEYNIHWSSVYNIWKGKTKHSKDLV